MSKNTRPQPRLVHPGVWQPGDKITFGTGTLTRWRRTWARHRWSLTRYTDDEINIDLAGTHPEPRVLRLEPGPRAASPWTGPLDRQHKERPRR